jgi:hypothetical protein
MKGSTMARSSLYHGEETPPGVLKGHGTAALGPSDSSDSGSDIQGGPGLNRDDGLLVPTGNTSDPDVDGAGATAAPDIGDANLDSDSDRFGTGERAAAGRDSTVPTDSVLRDTDSDDVIDGDSIGEDIDGLGAARDELAGSDAEYEDLASDGPGKDVATVASYRPVSAGQDVQREAPSGTSGGADEDLNERDHARADGRHAGEDEDLPVFDRGGREDLPREGSGRGSGRRSGV